MILSELKDVKKRLTEQRALQDVSETIPMSKVAYETKVKESNSLFTKELKELKPEEIKLKKHLSGNTKLGKDKVLENVSELDRTCIIDYAKKIAREDKNIGSSLNSKYL